MTELAKIEMMRGPGLEIELTNRSLAKVDQVTFLQHRLDRIGGCKRFWTKVSRFKAGAGTGKSKVTGVPRKVREGLTALPGKPRLTRFGLARFDPHTQLGRLRQKRGEPDTEYFAKSGENLAVSITCGWD